MSTLDFFVPKPQAPSLSFFHWKGLRNLPLPPLSKTQIPFPPPRKNPKTITIQSFSPDSKPSLFPKSSPIRRNPAVSAGRSKKKPGGPSPGRIEGNAELRREAKKNARRKSRRLAENLFYRLKNPSRNHANNFSEEELQMIGLGYDRMVRFMEQDDPNLKHPYDWYKYGEYGPYSWRGIVVGDPIRGRVSDECVSMISSVRDHEEWEEIEKFEMAADFSRRVSSLDEKIGFKYFWVFVRHPKWRITDLPWEQWTLVSEVVLECGEKRLDKWNLMGRLGNKTRSLITQCAAWMRPDIVYVKRPIFQCRFEPQDDFFRVLGPLLDPESENQYLFELKMDDGRVEMCTYFGGLCKIVRANPKWFVDDVVNAYEKMSDERKSSCLEFLLVNHPVEMLHPYTKEWKAKLEEMELGCDDDGNDSDDDYLGDQSGTQIVDWIEEDDDEDVDKEEEDDDDSVIDLKEGGDEVLGIEEETSGPEENETYWEDEFQKALTSSDAMENLVKQSVETSTEFYKRQLRAMDEQHAKVQSAANEGEDGPVRKRTVSRQGRDEWETVSQGPRRRVKRSKIPPELFLRAAVRPFTYRNLVKEIVLLRHAIVDGDVSGKQ